MQNRSFDFLPPLHFSPVFFLHDSFTVLGFLIQRKGGDKAAFPVSTPTIILGALFIFAMTIASYYGTTFVRKVVMRFKESKQSKPKTKDLEALLDTNSIAIKELNQIAQDINDSLQEKV